MTDVPASAHSRLMQTLPPISQMRRLRLRRWSHSHRSTRQSQAQSMDTGLTSGSPDCHAFLGGPAGLWGLCAVRHAGVLGGSRVQLRSCVASAAGTGARGRSPTGGEAGLEWAAGAGSGQEAATGAAQRGPFPLYF